MGAKASKVALKPKEVARLSTASGFDPEHVKMLYAQFLSLKGIDDPSAVTDLTINLAEFQSALGYKAKESSFFLERIFKVFDENSDGTISFEEFLHGIGILTPTAAPEYRLKFSFQLYDSGRKGYISQADLKTMLAASLKENDLVLTDAQLDKMVGDTFRTYDLNRDGVLDFAEYQNMCALQPNVLKPFTLNVTDIIKAHADDTPSATAGGAGAAAVAAR